MDRLQKICLALLFAILTLGGIAAMRLSPLPEEDPPAGMVGTSTEPSLRPIEDRIGEMLMVGFRGTSVNASSTIVRDLQDLHLGGVILFDRDLPSKSFPRNILSAAQVSTLTRNLQRLSPVPLFIGVDAEGGRVNRLSPSYGFLNIPSHASLGAAPVAETVRSSSLLGAELRSLGINMNFAPVVDVNVSPQNPVIGRLGRSFSADEKIVISRAQAFMEEQKKNGVIPVIKHFPGHGSSGKDSHVGLTDVTATYEAKELAPFRELISRGAAEAVMTAHIMNRDTDPNYPATLSANFLAGILRNELGFRGVIISDDMQMGAIANEYGFEDALVRAIVSGVDLLVLSNNIDRYDPELARKAHAAILAAVNDGRISRERIIEASDRLRALKASYGIRK